MTLRIGFNEIGSSDKGIEAINILLKNPKLETLEINNIGLDDKGLAKIIDTLEDSNIKKIVMSSNDITDEGGRLLLRIKDKKVIAYDNEIEESSILEHLKRLEFI